MAEFDRDRLFIVHGDVTADATPRTDAVDLLHEPRTRLKKEILASQGTDRTDIYDIASEFIVEQPERVLIVVAWNINFVV